MAPSRIDGNGSTNYGDWVSFVVSFHVSSFHEAVLPFMLNYPPAYSIPNIPMRPVTKISIWGIRLAVLVLAIYWAMIFTGTHLPLTADFSPPINDKIKHFSAFFGLAFFLCYVTNSTNLGKRFTLIALVAMAYAAFDEFTQQFVPGRVCDVYDFLADSVGICTAISVYVSAKFMTRSQQSRQASLGPR